MTDPAPRYGVSRPDEIAGLTGLEIMSRIRDGRLPTAPIMRTLSFRLVEVGAGLAVFEGEPSAEILNPLGTVHGGWALTLVDSAAGCAAHTLLPADTGYTTLETKANFTRAIMPGTGTVRAEGRVVSPGRTVLTAEVRVTGPDGKLLAHGTSTLLVLAPR
ncbi:MAG TPA: PaaI family thioesterase [Burkholderiaceae bacterium]|nr:PaaI family thioesterase [Burkholderiaceae bacterium]